MKELLYDFMSCYVDDNIKIDSRAKYYKLLKKIAINLQKKYENRYLVKFSCGQGRKSEVPWVCIFNSNITENATNGIYVAILFKSDMSGFYISLCQGMESFKSKYGLNTYKYLYIVSDYFRSKINNSNFVLDNIDLNVKKNTRGYWYEQSSVISKFYQKDNFDEEEFRSGLEDIICVYESICNQIDSISYDEVISNIINNTVGHLEFLNDAVKNIENTLSRLSNDENVEVVTLTEIPVPKGNNKVSDLEVVKKNIKKVDYLEKTKSNIKIGNIGELLVLELEKQKMLDHKREDLINKIEHNSLVDDSLGFDIKSFDFDDNGNEYQIYIEVKTTDLNCNSSFFITTAELNALTKYKDKYYIYRVINDTKTYYRINGIDFCDKIELSVQNYIANLKSVKDD